MILINRSVVKAFKCQTNQIEQQKDILKQSKTDKDGKAKIWRKDSLVWGF